MYSLLSIFIIIPLIFSHTFARLGEYFIIENGIGSFESVKVSFFLLLLFFASIEFFFSGKFILEKRNLLLFSGLTLFLILEFLLFGKESLFGIGEKQHGSLFFAAIVWFGYLVSLVQKEYIPLFKKSILMTGVVVSITAIVEFYFSYNLFTGFFSDPLASWGDRRATATLGNPNYVAGYLLLLLPIVASIEVGKKRIAIILTIFSGILATGSYIGIALSLLFLIYFMVKNWKAPYQYLFGGIILISLIFFVSYLEGSNKWLSFISRFILMKETFIASLGSIPSFLVGNGPNGIIEYYSGIRTGLIDSYFPRDMIIDSSHNLLIDIFFKFGFPGIMVLFYSLIKRWNLLSSVARECIVFGGIFFSLNVTILSAYILFLFALCSKNEKL